MAVPVLEGTPTTVTGTADTEPLSLSKPAGTATDELLVIIVGDDDLSSSNWGPSEAPTGFTFMQEAGDATEDCHVAVYTRVVDGTEAATFDINGASSGGATDVWAICFRVSGVDTSDPINQTGTAGTSGGDSTSHAITGVTTDVDDCLCVYVLAFDGGDGPPFSVSGTGWAEQQEITSGGTASGNASGVWGTRDLATAGASGTATVTSNVSDGSAFFQFAVAPAAGGATFPDAPENFTATAVSTSQINLSWDAVTGAGGYDIERDSTVIVSDQAGTTYNDTGLSTGTSYDYRVRAVT